MVPILAIKETNSTLPLPITNAEYNRIVPGPVQQAHLPTPRLWRNAQKVGIREKVYGVRHAVHCLVHHRGGKVKPPGQGRRSRLTCPPPDFGEMPQKAGIREKVYGVRHAVRRLVRHRGGKVKPSGQGWCSRLTCPPPDFGEMPFANYRGTVLEAKVRTHADSRVASLQWSDSEPSPLPRQQQLEDAVSGPSHPACLSIPSINGTTRLRPAIAPGPRRPSIAPLAPDSTPRYMARHHVTKQHRITCAVQPLACYFCRGRKIACGPPANQGSGDRTCEYVVTRTSVSFH